MDKSDHDVLIAHDIKLQNICKTLGDVDKKLDKLNDKMDENVKTYITKKMFMWVNGIIIAGLIILGGYMSNIDKQVIENKVVIEQMIDK